MSKKPQVIGRIIRQEIREVDHSFIPNTNKMSLEETIQYVKDLYGFESDKTEMNEIIEQIKENWSRKE